MLGLLYLVVSCSPMGKDILTDSNTTLPVEDGYEIAGSDDGSTITLRFKAIRDAESYGYGKSIDTVTPIDTADLQFDNGYYTVSLNRSTVISSSSSGRTTKSAAGTVTLSLYASPEVSPTSWILIKDFDISLSLGDAAPQLMMGTRLADSVELDAISEVDPGNMTYRIEYEGQPKPIEISSISLPYTLENIGQDALTLTISHKFTGTGEYGEIKQELSIPAYDPNAINNIEYTQNEDGSLTLSKMPAGGEYSEIELFAVDQNNALISLGRMPFADEITFPKETFGDGFFAATLKIGAYKTGEQTSPSMSTQTYNYSTKDIVVDNETTGLQSYSSSIKISEKIPSYSLSYSGISGITVTQNGSQIDISAPMGTLVSRTEYTLHLVFTLPMYGECVKEVNFTTGSFAGEYEWSAGGLQFAVRATEAPSGSAYNYYMYVSEYDDAYDGTAYRLSPFYDPVSDASAPQVPCDYSSAPGAYKWNNKKWNSSSFDPNEFSSYSIESTNSKDIARTVCTSTAMFGIRATTTSQFSFIEHESGIYLVFYNEITAGTGDSYLRKNPDYQNNVVSPKDNHYYELRLTDR